MSEYYRTIFTIDGEERRGLDLLGDVEGVLREWIVERFDKPVDGYGEWQNESETLRIDGGALGDTGFFGLSSTLTNGWKLDFGLATKGGSVEADVQVQEIADVTASSNGNLRAGPPRMLSAVLEEFRCDYEGERLTPEPTHINLQDADSFVRDDIFNPDRKLPLIVVTETHQGKTLLDPVHLQSRLMGLAKVVTYNDDTTRKVNSHLGKLECYLGAVRIYLPDCSLESSPWEHKLWLPKDVGNDIWTEIRNICMQHSRFLFRYRMYREVSANVRQRENERNKIDADNYKREAQAYRERLQHRQADKDTYEELLDASANETSTYKQLLEVSENENSRLNKELEEKDFAILELEEQLKQLQDDDATAEDDGEGESFVSRGRYEKVLNQAKGHKYRADKAEDENRILQEQLQNLQDAGQRPASDKSRLEVRARSKQTLSSVAEAVQNAEEKMKGLRFLPNAVVTAKSNYTKNHDDKALAFYRTFGVLNECASLRAKGPLDQTTTKWLASRNVKFSDESEDTKRRPHCTKARTFDDPESGLSILMTHHVKLLNNDIRIHLWWEDTENKWLIGHIGEHLPTSSDPH